MSTNFLVFNPNLSNSESDAAYSADTMRQNGASAGAIFGSPLANKAFYQWSMMVTALATMLKNKGYTVLDSDFNTLVSALANLKTTVDFASSLIAVPYATSIVFNASTSSGFEVTLSGDVSSSSLIGLVAGQQLTFVIIQDATGGRAFSWPSPISTSAVCSAPSSITVQQFEVLIGATQLVPRGPAVWISSSGIAFPTQEVQSISTSGSCVSGYASLIERVNTTGGAITRNLYSAVGYSGFQVIGIKTDTSHNAVTYTPATGQTIDGFANYAISKPYNAITLVSDGANWWLV